MKYSLGMAISSTPKTVCLVVTPETDEDKVLCALLEDSLVRIEAAAQGWTFFLYQQTTKPESK